MDIAFAVFPLFHIFALFIHKHIHFLFFSFPLVIHTSPTPLFLVVDSQREKPYTFQRLLLFTTTIVNNIGTYAIDRLALA